MSKSNFEDHLEAMAAEAHKAWEAERYDNPAQHRIWGEEVTGSSLIDSETDNDMFAVDE